MMNNKGNDKGINGPDSNIDDLRRTSLNYEIQSKIEKLVNRKSGQEKKFNNNPPKRDLYKTSSIKNAEE